MLNKKNKFLGIAVLLVSLAITITACDMGGNGIDQTRLTQEANNIVDDFLTAMENSSVSGIENTLSSDFTYTNSHRWNKDDFLDLMSMIFSAGGNYTKAQLNNRVNEIVTNTKIKISGSFLGEGYDIDGYYFHIIHPAQFTVEREGNRWKITQWIDE